MRVNQVALVERSASDDKYFDSQEKQKWEMVDGLFYLGNKPE